MVLSVINTHRFTWGRLAIKGNAHLRKPSLRLLAQGFRLSTVEDIKTKGDVMSDVVTTIKSSSNPDVAAAAAQFLSQVVIDSQALVINGKQAHWHVRGANFIAVHELFDEVVERAEDYADTAAERVVALGLPLDARIGTVAAKTTLPELPAGFQPADIMIAALVASIDAVLVSVNKAIKELGAIDAASQDVAIQIARSLEKDRWFLFAHIATV
jgi:starvation-inducible DNA-binding protein